MAEEIYCSHTCKNCESAFMDIDEVNAFYSAPNYKYCPDCVKKGFKNTSKNREEYKPVARLEEHIYNWTMEATQPKEDVDFIFDKCMNTVKEYYEFGKKINTRSIFLQAVEVLGYYKEELKEKNNEQV